MNKEIHRVISLKEGRVSVAEEEGRWIVKKRTSTLEAMQLALLQHTLSEDRTSRIHWGDNDYAIAIPNFVLWDEQNGVLQMEYCEGENLETQLMHTRGEERSQFVDLTAKIIKWMKENGVLIRDAAPRNTLVNTGNKKITLIDFERPLVIKSGAFEIDEFNLLVRGNISEEFCAFLFPSEQEEVFPNIWEGNENTLIDMQSILSGRQRLLLTHLYGEQEGLVRVSELAHAQKMMSDTVTPFFLDGEPFFPLIYMEKSPTSKDYIDKVIELQNTPKALWKEILTV